MRVELPGAIRTGRAVDLRGTDRDRDAVRAAIGEGAAWLGCPAPGPLFERVGVVDGTAVRRRGALAAAARSRGLTAPQDERRRAVRERLADLPDPDRVDARSLRRAVAEASAETDRLRERVARLQGRVQAGRESDEGGDATADAEADLSAATRELAERETELAAAEQALARARERRREYRDARERRRRLEDRAANLDRAARDHLAAQVRGEYRVALAALPDVSGVESAPGPGTPDAGGSKREAESAAEPAPAAVALAAYRVGEPAAPVVLACDRFSDPATAADWLDAPVLRL